MWGFHILVNHFVGAIVSCHIDLATIKLRVFSNVLALMLPTTLTGKHGLNQVSFCKNDADFAEGRSED